LGSYAGSRLHKKIPEGKFSRYVFVLLLMIGVLFIAKTLSS
jgi:uncharacterized membrane protein YfcA